MGSLLCESQSLQAVDDERFVLCFHICSHVVNIGFEDLRSLFCLEMFWNHLGVRELEFFLREGPLECE